VTVLAAPVITAHVLAAHVSAAHVLATSTSALDQPGTLGFLVVFGMGVILFFVFRSMAKHLRKVNTAARQDALAAASDSSMSDGTVTGSAPKDGTAPR
jgi:hypothetical protein